MFKDRDRETIMVVGVGILAIGIVAVFLIFSPSGGDLGRREVPGPPEVQEDAVAAHAAQFDDDLPDRVAGSQEEQAAATYILGVMQQNGYVVRLESVPVSNLVNSTNLIALPPGIEEPETVIVVPYDVPEPERERDPFAGETLGVFLETARALNVADPEHRVAWVAIGAESAETDREFLGSRRLIRFMLDEDWDPQVIQASAGFEFAADGALADTFDDVYRQVSGEAPPASRIVRDEDLYGAAGFENTIVTAPSDVLSPLLLESLF